MSKGFYTTATQPRKIYTILLVQNWISIICIFIYDNWLMNTKWIENRQKLAGKFTSWQHTLIECDQKVIFFNITPLWSTHFHRCCSACISLVKKAFIMWVEKNQDVTLSSQYWFLAKCFSQMAPNRRTGRVTNQFKFSHAKPMKPKTCVAGTFSSWKKKLSSVFQGIWSW